MQKRSNPVLCPKNIRSKRKFRPFGLATDKTWEKTVDLRERYAAGRDWLAKSGCLAGPGIKKAGILAGLSLT